MTPCRSGPTLRSLPPRSVRVRAQPGPLLSDRHQYLVAPKGRIRVNGVEANPRDGVAITGEGEIVVEALDDAEIVLVDAR